MSGTVSEGGETDAAVPSDSSGPTAAVTVRSRPLPTCAVGNAPGRVSDRSGEAVARRVAASVTSSGSVTGSGCTGGMGGGMGGGVGVSAATPAGARRGPVLRPGASVAALPRRAVVRPAAGREPVTSTASARALFAGAPSPPRSEAAASGANETGRTGVVAGVDRDSAFRRVVGSSASFSDSSRDAESPSSEPRGPRSVAEDVPTADEGASGTGGLDRGIPEPVIAQRTSCAHAAF